MTIPTTDAGAVVPSGNLLDALRSRLIARACVCSTAIQKAVAEGRYHDAHKSMIRRDIFLAAADMAEQEIEQASNTALRVGEAAPSNGVPECPSCGCEGHWQEGPPGFWRVHCRDCGIGTAPMPSQDAARKVWSRRHSNDEHETRRVAT